MNWTNSSRASILRAFDAFASQQEQELRSQQDSEREQFANAFLLAAEDKCLDSQSSRRLLAKGMKSGARMLQKQRIQRTAFEENQAVFRRSVELRAMSDLVGASGLFASARISAPIRVHRKGGDVRLPLKAASRDFLWSSPAVTVDAIEDSVQCHDECNPVVARPGQVFAPTMTQSRKRRYLPGDLHDRDCQTDPLPEGDFGDGLLVIQLDTSEGTGSVPPEDENGLPLPGIAPAGDGDPDIVQLVLPKPAQTVITPPDDLATETEVQAGGGIGAIVDQNEVCELVVIALDCSG
jgi:hypothetical protein